MMQMAQLDHTWTLVTNFQAQQNPSAFCICCNYHRSASVSSTIAGLSLTFPYIVKYLIHANKIYPSNASLKSKLLLRPSYVSARVDHYFKDLSVKRQNTSTPSKKILYFAFLLRKLFLRDFVGPLFL